MSRPIRVTVWNEHIHERTNPEVARIYPAGIHGALRAALEAELGDAVHVRTATLDQPEHGLSERALAETDVLTWWGHTAHDQVADVVAERVQRRVLEGMGLLALHSAHYAKVFRRLMGTGCGLRWRESGELERVWVVEPAHPITDGLDGFFELPRSEMYGERFDVPAPEQLIFISWFEGGEVFRSGCCYTRGRGRIFYFGPGHETYPIYHDLNVRRVLANGVRWAATQSSHPYRYDALHAEQPPHPPSRAPV